MKTHIIFNLDDPDERETHERMLKADDFMLAIYDFDQYLRKIVKYGDEKSQILNAEEVRTKLWEIINERDLGKFI